MHAGPVAHGIMTVMVILSTVTADDISGFQNKAVNVMQALKNCLRHRTFLGPFRQPQLVTAGVRQVGLLLRLMQLQLVVISNKSHQPYAFWSIW